MRPTWLLTALAVVLFAANASHGQQAPGASGADPLDVEMFYQFSESDNDAEVTLDIESGDHAIDSLFVLGPRGGIMATIRSHDRLGLAEIELESAEPSVEEVQRAYPEGTYRFWGRAVDGTRLYSRLALTHRVVAAPDFVDFSPCGQDVDAGTAVAITWSPVAGADRGYEIIIEQDDTGANLRVTQSPDRTSFVIPDGFLAPGLEYEIEMKSVTAGGNKTSASCEFNTQ